MIGTVYIMSGLPGSGKSTLTRQIARHAESSLDSVRVISHDDYFMEGDDYKFTTEKYDCIARPRCQDDFLKAIKEGVECIIVDNLNMNLDDCIFYINGALVNGYDLMFRQSSTPWRWDVEECAERNLHGVTAETIQKKKDRYEPRIKLIEYAERACDNLGIINMERLQIDEDNIGLTRTIYPGA